MDRLEEWRVFTTVATEKSFSRAAKRLARSPQAVTRAVAALESRLGTRLLHRTTRSVSLTHDGEQYLEHARRALGEFDALEAPRDSELRGTLSVTASVLFGQHHVAPIVASFLAEHPAATARLVLLDRVVSLAEEGLDVGVRIGDLPDSALIARLAGHVRVVICASPKYLDRAPALRTDTLDKHAHIAFTGTRPLAKNPKFTVNTAGAAIELALAGHGLTRVLSYQIAPYGSRLRVVMPSLEPPPLPVHLVYLPGRLPRITAAFVEHALPQLQSRLLQ
jgi:DNA-binding transcriptional LysR family regulator